MMNLNPLPLGFQTFISATGAQALQPVIAGAAGLQVQQQPLPAWLVRWAGPIKHPYFQTRTLLAGRKSNDVEIIDGDEDDDEEIHPVTPPAPRSGEGVPLHISIDDRPPPPGWRAPERGDPSQGDGRREGGIITITPDDDDPTKVDFTI